MSVVLWFIVLILSYLILLNNASDDFQFESLKVIAKEEYFDDLMLFQETSGLPNVAISPGSNFDNLFIDFNTFQESSSRSTSSRATVLPKFVQFVWNDDKPLYDRNKKNQFKNLPNTVNQNPDKIDKTVNIPKYLDSSSKQQQQLNTPQKAVSQSSDSKQSLNIHKLSSVRQSSFNKGDKKLARNPLAKPSSSRTSVISTQDSGVALYSRSPKLPLLSLRTPNIFALSSTGNTGTKSNSTDVKDSKDSKDKEKIHHHRKSNTEFEHSTDPLHPSNIQQMELYDDEMNEHDRIIQKETLKRDLKRDIANYLRITQYDRAANITDKMSKIGAFVFCLWCIIMIVLIVYFQIKRFQ